MSRKVSVALLLMNVAGTAIYLLRARLAWVIPEEEQHGIHVIAGEPFIWTAAILPVCAIFLAANLTWAATIPMRKRPQDGRIWLSIVAMWIVAVLIDFAHH
jgi:hypothetical protein